MTSVIAVGTSIVTVWLVVAAVTSIVATGPSVITMTPVIAVVTSIVHSVNAVVVTMVVAVTRGGVAISTVKVAIPRMGAL